MPIAHTLASLVLVGGIATACGGDGSDAPDDASDKDFCEAVEAAPSDGKPSQDDVDEWVDKLQDTGTRMTSTTTRATASRTSSRTKATVRT